MASSKYTVVENNKEVYKALGMIEFIFSCGEKTSEGRVKIVKYDKNYFLKAYSYLNNTQATQNPGEEKMENDAAEEVEEILQDETTVKEKPQTPAEKKFNELFTFPIRDLTTGEEFVNSVKEGFLMSSDGQVSEIFVNGMKSNLSFFDSEKGHFGHGFMVDIDTFEKMCKVFDIEVNFAHK